MENTVTLRTNRLILRPVRVDDAQAMVKWTNDPRVVEFLSYAPYADLTVAKQNIQAYFIQDGLGKFGIEMAGELIGTIDIRFDLPNKKAEIGYALCADFWGQGIVPEAAQALIAYGFNQFDIDMIEIFNDVRNPKSGRVAEKLGFTRLPETIHETRNIQGQPQQIEDVAWQLTRVNYERNL